MSANQRKLILAALMALLLTPLYYCGRSAGSARDLGEECTWNLDCASDLCLPERASDQPTGWAGGMCVQTCLDQECPAPTICEHLAETAYCLPSCDEDGDCRAGYVCGSNGACLPDCREGWDCGTALTCGEDGRCAVPTTGTAALGAACSADWACESGVCFAATDEDGGATGWKDGSCVAPCTTDCPGACVAIDGQGWCVAGCTDGGCRDGYVCAPDTDVCLPDCRLGWDCGTNFACSADGICELVTPDLGELGDACAGDWQCATGVCFEAQNSTGPTGWTGGACAEPCNGDCAGDCVVLDQQAWCLQDCIDRECRDGYVCAPLEKVCLPDCRTGFDCGSNFVCGEDGNCELVTTTLAALGESCVGDGDCESGICFEQADTDGGIGWTRGSCVAPCTLACTSECVVLEGAAWCLAGCGDASCRDGYVCDPNNDVCLPDCRLGWDCGTNFACEADGSCSLQGGELAALGEPCASDHECASGLCFEAIDSTGATGWADGMCAAPCTAACTEACVVLDGQPWCLPGCTDTAECRSGYVCSDNLGACLPDCRNGWDCATGYICATDGQCAADTTQNGGTGDACTSDADCTSGVCLLPASDVTPLWQNGTCTGDCADGCPTGTVCTPFTGVSYCLASCADQSDCGGALICDPQLDVCVPNCQLGWDCPSDTQCNMAGLCRRQGPGGNGGG